MSRMFLGRERTFARKALAKLAARYPDPSDLAHALNMKRHSVAPLLDGRARPCRRLMQVAARILPA